MQTATVLGLGTMGHGIAQTLAVSGWDVRVFDDQEDVLDSVLDRIQSNIRILMEFGLLTDTDPDRVVDRLTICETEQSALQGSEFVTESIVEDLQTKQSLFQRCEHIVQRSTILASNTSSFPITQIASGLQYPERAINTHWFNPPHLIPVVEIVPGECTSALVVERVMELFISLGKQPIHVRRETPGFVLNRIQVAMFREMLDLIERGVITAEDLDTAVRGSLGLRWAAAGPMRVGDFGGWDVLAKVYEVLAPDLRSDSQVPGVLNKMVGDGAFGIKSGQGFFEYPEDEVPRIIAEKDHRFMAWAKILADTDH